jgi:glycogen debranching enzyme
MTSKLNRAEIQSLWNLGLAKLKELQSPYGFNASEHVTGLYDALFGRDSLWVLILLLEASKFNPDSLFLDWIEEVGSLILTSLCQFQGNVVDHSVEEQPGKIIHEYHEYIDQRLLASQLPLKNGSSYTGFDQTFLFIIAVKQFSERFPDHSLVDLVWGNVERALGWIEKWADEDGDGLFEYIRRDRRNLINQAWKDSFDSVTHTGFDDPPQPIAWIEVQAYAYRAFLDAAFLYRQRNDISQSQSYIERAQMLKNHVNVSFWLTEEDCFAIALDGEKRKVSMVSSNPGHALWAEIVNLDRVELLVQRLMAPDMMTPYGFRTLSESSPYYAPFAYHRGNIWPFDNMIFASGLLKYGFTSEAQAVMQGVGRAILTLGYPTELYIALNCQLFQLQPQINIEQPEVMLTKRQPVAKNQNQAWTSASLLFCTAALASLNGENLS